MTDQVPIEHPPGARTTEATCARRARLGHLLHHQGLALDEEMIHEERVHDRERRGPAPDGRAAGPGRGDGR